MPSMAVPFVDINEGTITDSYATGTMSVLSGSGFVTNFLVDSTDPFKTEKIINSYTTVVVHGSGAVSSFGMFPSPGSIGQYAQAIVSNSFWNKTLNPNLTSQGEQQFQQHR